MVTSHGAGRGCGKFSKRRTSHDSVSSSEKKDKEERETVSAPLKKKIPGSDEQLNNRMKSAQ